MRSQPLQGAGVFLHPLAQSLGATLGFVGSISVGTRTREFGGEPLTRTPAQIWNAAPLKTKEPAVGRELFRSRNVYL